MAVRSASLPLELDGEADELERMRIRARVHAAGQGDTRAQRWLIEQVLADVRRVARALLRATHESDDAAQYALLQVLRAASSYRGDASVRHWDGATWSPVDVPHNVNVVPALQAVDGNGPDNVWIVGQNGTVLHWDGSVWEELDPPLQDEDFSVVDVDDAGDVWTSRALPSRLYRYHAGGWLIRPLPLHILLYATTEASDNSRWWLGSRLIEVWH